MQPLPPSFYRLTAGQVPTYAPLRGSRRADVCVIGGGFAGLSAALHLAEAGADVVLLEATSVADGASGRNGGQIHSGQRQDVLWLEKNFGHARAKELWDLAEEAKALVRQLIVRFAIPCQLRSGVIEAVHRPELMEEAEAQVEALATRYNYDRVTLLDQVETIQALGSQAYFGAINDRGGGHLDPFRFAHGLAGAAASLGAAIHEGTEALSLDHDGGPVVRTAAGDIRAGHVIVATNGRSGPLETVTKRRIIGVKSYILATEPLGALGDAILPGGESAADTRFVVRYWRKSADNRLIFGGGESSAGQMPADLAGHVRPHLLHVYPQVESVPVAHAWAGIVSVTLPRLPFVREIATDVMAAGGFSGQGVALAPFLGKLLAENALGRPTAIEAFRRLPIPRLPTWTPLRRALVTLAIAFGSRRDRI
jgi:gamma-glutamylputrescine oxidase